MGGSVVIELASHAATSAGAPVRKLVYMVLLLAIKDRAAEVQFEPSPSDGVWKLRYRIGGAWYEMAPVPLRVPISREIRRLAGLGLPLRLRTLLRSLTRDAGEREARVRLLVAGQAVYVGFTFEPAGVGGASRTEVVALRLPEGELPSEEARQILMEYLRSRQAGAS
jgi:hypothetical protein